MINKIERAVHKVIKTNPVLLNLLLGKVKKSKEFCKILKTIKLEGKNG